MVKQFYKIGMLLTIIVLASTVNGEIYEAPKVTAVEILENIKIDGHLDENAWKCATKITNFYEIAPADMGEPDVKTTAFICYDNENIYIACICYDNMNEIKAWDTYETPIVYGDFILIAIGTFISVSEVYWLYVNPYGLKQTLYYMLTDPKRGGEYAEQLDITWFAECQRTDSCWTAEIQVPFRSLRFTSKDNLRWRFDISRSRPRNNAYYYCWSPQPHGEFSMFAYMGWLTIPKRILLAQKFEFLPYLAAGLETATDSNINFKYHTGISGKYFFTYVNILDFAVAPDYSQIEADAPQIDINAPFALYYEERRPFFTERKAFFEMPFNMFYTRTIDNPLFALKYTGSIKGTDIGYVAAYDQNTPWILPFAEQSFSVQSNKNSISNIVKIKQYFSENSEVSLVSTNRNLFTNGYNHVIGIDGVTYLFKTFSIIGQGAVSWTKEPNDTTIFPEYSSLDFDTYTSAFDGESFTGGAYCLGLVHNSKYLTVNGSYRGYTPEFRADNGYIRKNNLESRTLDASIKLYVRRMFIEGLYPNLGLNQELLFLGHQTSFEKYLGLNFLLQHQITVGVRYSSQDQDYQDLLFPGMKRYLFSIVASPMALFTAGTVVDFGNEINYFASPAIMGYILYPYAWIEIHGNKLAIKFNASRYLLWVDEFNNRTYDATTLELEPSWSFTKFLCLRLLIQHYSSDNEMFISPLLSFEPTPFTLFYLGSNYVLNKSPSLNGWLDYNMKKNKIFIKVQYEFLR